MACGSLTVFQCRCHPGTFRSAAVVKKYLRVFLKENAEAFADVAHSMQTNVSCGSISEPLSVALYRAGCLGLSCATAEVVAKLLLVSACLQTFKHLNKVCFRVLRARVKDSSRQVL